MFLFFGLHLFPIVEISLVLAFGLASPILATSGPAHAHALDRSGRMADKAEDVASFQTSGGVGLFHVLNQLIRFSLLCLRGWSRWETFPLGLPLRG